MINPLLACVHTFRAASLVGIAGIASIVGAAGLAGSARADEGLWLLSKPPAERLNATYGFTPSAEWLLKAQQASVDPGASGSFVSARGLVMTNQHVASDAIAKLSTAERDLIKDGFYAASPEQELKCKDTEITVLIATEDVTARVQAAVKPGSSPTDAAAARRAAMAEIEQAATAETGLECTVVTLYQGGQYHLYSSKKFTDVRLVFCPEFQAAFFGGDNDNFEYPRFCMDVTFLRVYENGKPYAPANYFKWSANGAAEGELVFVLGHPGRTQRLLTTEHLAFLRDVELPITLANLWRGESNLQRFAQRSAENQRVASEDSFGLANSRKAFLGQLEGLQDPAFFKAKQTEQDALKAAIAKNADLQKNVGDAWKQIADARNAAKPWFARFQAIRAALRYSWLNDALTIARMGDELAKPSGERLREFRESNLAALKAQIVSPAPIYPSFEQARIADALAGLAAALGAEDPVVVGLLAGKSPQERARMAVSGSKLFDVAERTRLLEAGPAAIKASTDSLLVLARGIDAENRRLRALSEDVLDGAEKDAYAKLADARFAVYGDSVYPDATGTLRLSYGTVKGYIDDGKRVPAFTTFGGLFAKAAERADNKDYALPARWIEAKSRLDLSVPFNFVCTADIIGGNSGSPVINKAGEIVGLIFDGNIESLPNAFLYRSNEDRAVAVDSRGIKEALKTVYKADALVAELEGK